MKPFVLALLVGLFGLVGVQAQADSSTDYLVTAWSKIILTYVETNSASFTVYNPGKVSGICGLIMVANTYHEDFQDLTSLLDRFDISTAIDAKAPMIHKKFTRFSLLNSELDRLNLNTLHISTKDGKSIAENIKAIYKYPVSLGMTVDFCKQHS